MVTIKDVAARAGVAFKTVSRVINKDETVKAGNREKVLRAIEELGYRPNRAAQMTRRKKSGVVGFIADELLDVPYTFDIIRGAQDEAWRSNKELMVVNVSERKYSASGAVEHLLAHRVEGVIYASMYHRQVIIPELLNTVPTVLANCYDQNHAFTCIVPDELNAARQITNQLLDKGYRRVVFLNLNPKIIAAELRKQGVEEAFRQRFGSTDNLHVESVINDVDNREVSTTRERAKALITEFKPDAIICGQDPMAVEVYFVAQALGLQVGRDIGIASFDNWDVLPQLVEPQLSTMALPHYDMGKWAFNYLQGPQTINSKKHTAPFEFIRRASF
ncbi:LacI family DNA-binding transcriptional regulator [Salinimonas lutimaris]|uniref:LacI family DNA-binding transcriptional regulator n=1 Tax=Salinimonas lutimaris TaxID=914153 RepID=UPI0010C048CE|nr:LacI family DNA-binding transcriptional regulator [Salinimonas lutimaris]